MLAQIQAPAQPVVLNQQVGKEMACRVHVQIQHGNFLLFVATNILNYRCRRMCTICVSNRILTQILRSPIYFILALYQPYTEC